jgi:hypothetical protein
LAQAPDGTSVSLASTSPTHGVTHYFTQTG